MTPRQTSQQTAKLAARLMAQYRPLPSGRCCRENGSSLSIENTVVPAGKPHMVVSMREALFTDRQALSITVPLDYTIQTLRDSEAGVWMTNQPCELVQMWRELAQPARGRVLVAGLGLGVVVDMLVRKQSVEQIIVIERDACVIQLAKFRECAKVTIQQGDALDYARQLSIPKLASDRYDWALLDTWQGTGEWAWVTEVVPLRRALCGKVAHAHVRAWMEDVMLGQVLRGLIHAAGLPPEWLHGACVHWQAFSAAVRRQGIQTAVYPVTEKVDARTFEVEQANAANPNLRALAGIFCREVGSPVWEQAFGWAWDEALRLREEGVA